MARVESPQPDPLQPVRRTAALAPKQTPAITLTIAGGRVIVASLDGISCYLRPPPWKPPLKLAWAKPERPNPGWKKPG
jgi:hypothetical protein